MNSPATHATRVPENTQGICTKYSKTVLKPAGDHEVEESDWAVFGQSRGTALVGPLGACLGVVFHCSQTGLSVVGHFPEPEGSDATKLRKMLDLVKELYPNMAKVRARLGGISDVEEVRTVAQARGIRLRIKEEVTRLGCESVSCEWSTPSCCVAIRIKLLSGQIDFSHSEE